MKNWLNITCKQATFLIVKEEHVRLSWFDSLKLKLHIGICSLCARFLQQSRFISHHAKDVASVEPLSAEAKEKMEKAMVNDTQ